MMDAVDRFELAHGVYPVAFDRRWHCGVHLSPDMHGAVHAIADGDVVAYRVCQHAIGSGASHAGFVLLRHATDTGDGRKLTFYSLYMHLLPLAEYHTFGYDGRGLPDFLHKPTGQVAQGQVTPAAAGGGHKVRRKDIIGYLGRYQGLVYLHCEVFMMPGDFDAYFGHTQLGNTSPSTPATLDYWGHTYYTIPAGQQFFALPPGTDAHNKLHGIKFEVGQTGTNAQPLVVETYFSKGAKYTNVWSVAADGSRTLLTDQPVAEADYEYDLYKRATALYGTCPSDGYEMLRFGRILSTPAILSAAASATWIQVTYAAGQQGYINISNAAIKKLSDADFPSFMGWQKVSEGNTPFSSDGLCDIDALRKLVKDAADSERPTVSTATTEVQKADTLSSYVRGHDGVRQALRGFICHAPSEWDSTGNATRYARLLDEGGFYHGNEQGYNKFLNYLKEIQFWDVTGLPPGEKLWFFHPLAFIRHFRRCGWLSLKELATTLPRHSSLNAGGNISWSEAKRRWQSGSQTAGFMPPKIGIEVNRMWRKYGFSTTRRQTHFLAQVFKETSALRSTVEGGDDRYFRTMYEVLTSQEAGQDFDHKHQWLQSMGFLRGRDRSTYIAQRPGEVAQKAQGMGNIVPGDGPRFRGRGLIHLTGRNSYNQYGIFRVANFTVDTNPNQLSDNAETVADSAGYFWVSKIMQSPNTGALRSGMNIHRRADVGTGDANVAAITTPVNGGSTGLAERKEFFKYIYFVLGDEPTPLMAASSFYQNED
ncbi:hypothetical protein EYW47_38680 [Paraburkholderia silviterrae]|uniref:Chitinase n=2 Tax=Paraburkholderia silviterrae TaxID=2528715 RepID=A0A4R5LY30_9BURK|nr:hypothetical protein EYW47_38680 [Paraburkholderia silviterrae]